jgi:hydroxymethylpyrimidine/phosphomethylpyrimidine kinase
VHGTGCHLASAAAALLALGVPLREACEGARAYLSAVVAAAGRPGDGARHVVLHGPETRAAAEAAVSAALTSPGRTRAPLGGGGAT